jgi:hypothetical protein
MPTIYSLMLSLPIPGLFSCTGGQIRLHFSIPRSAFVCGENIAIDGRVENKTDRRIGERYTDNLLMASEKAKIADKVYAVLQQVVVIYNDSKNPNLKVTASLLNPLVDCNVLQFRTVISTSTTWPTSTKTTWRCSSMKESP